MHDKNFALRKLLRCSSLGGLLLRRFSSDEERIV